MVSSSNYQELFLSSTKMRKKSLGFPNHFAVFLKLCYRFLGQTWPWIYWRLGFSSWLGTVVAYRNGFSDNWPAFWAYLWGKVLTIWKICGFDWIWSFHDVSDFSVKHPEMMQSWPRRMRSVSCFAKMSSFNQDFFIAKRSMAATDPTQSCKKHVQCLDDSSSFAMTLSRSWSCGTFVMPPWCYEIIFKAYNHRRGSQFWKNWGVYVYVHLIISWWHIMCYNIILSYH